MKTVQNNLSSIKTGAWIRIFLGILLLALVLARISTGFVSFHGWVSFVGVLFIGIGLIWFGWSVIQSDQPPKWLWTALIAAALLRLLFGVFWLLALPAWGYDTPVQNAGYIMADAYDRDNAAWELSQSDPPLVAAFQDYSRTDQYGGLLFLSAFVYKYIGGNIHQPLLLIIFTASFSAIAVAFTWAIAKRIWGDNVSKISAWLLVIYPEAVLLGSSQMREAFMVTLAAAAIYGLVRYWPNRSLKNGLWFILPLAASVPLSLPFSLLLFVVLAVSAIALDEWHLLKSKRFWTALGGFSLAILIVEALNLYDFSKLWVFQVARWQAYYSESASGWVQRTFERFPDGMEWAQRPFLVGYGIFRPLLPASFFDGIPLMRALAIWRALGWTLLLAMLFYATFLVLRGLERNKLAGGFVTISWMIVVVASLRGGGDQWDNPRYRSAFAGVQIALAGWALVKQREVNDPWLRRALVGTTMMIAWFIPWYLRRYTAFTWPVVALHQTIGLGLISALLFIIWDWVREQRSYLTSQLVNEDIKHG